MRQNLYVFSLYRNPDLDDRICDCLLASMAAVLAEDIRVSFLHLTLQLSPIVISWLSAQPMHVVEHLNS